MTTDGKEGASMSKEELKAYLSEIEQQVVNSTGTYMHSVIALNEILRRPNVESLLDHEMKGQMHDLWIKLKSSGIQLTDPPLLFGVPEDFGSEEDKSFEDEEVEEIFEEQRRLEAARAAAEAEAAAAEEEEEDDSEEDDEEPEAEESVPEQLN